MKKITLTSILSLCIACPAIAVDDVDIAKNTGTADCTNTVLHTTTGPTALEAAWDANTIQLKFYNDDEQFSTGECTYDGGIALPETDPTKTGYTFDGWQVRPPVILFDLSTLDASTPGSTYGFSRLDGNAGLRESTYGLTVGSGEWAIEFDYGTVKGIAKCSAKSGNNHSYAWGGNSADWLATESELTSATGKALNCWCKVTGFDAEKDGNYTPVSSVASPLWVFLYDYGSVPYCAEACANFCAADGRNRAAFRPALYNLQ